MDTTNLLLNTLKNKILGLKSCYIRVGYGGLLKLGLGDKISYMNAQLNGKYHGEWDISSRQCTWRVRRENRILCGHEDEIEYSSKKLHSIELGIVIDLIQTNICDFTIVFDSGFIIDYFMNKTYDPQLHIIENSNSAYELTEDGLMEIDPLELYEKVTEIDSVLNVYSDECCKRWSKFVCKISSDKTCEDCFYFRSINGSFHFWKFGICSNCESEFDGKLVGNESGCEQFNQLKDLTT